MAAVESSSSVVYAEALTYMLCLSSENRAYSEGRTEAGYIFFVLWERCFLYGYQRDLGRVSVSKCFHSCSTGSTLDWDS